MQAYGYDSKAPGGIDYKDEAQETVQALLKANRLSELNRAVRMRGLCRSVVKVLLILLPLAIVGVLAGILFHVDRVGVASAIAAACCGIGAAGFGGASEVYDDHITPKNKEN